MKIYLIWEYCGDFELLIRKKGVVSISFCMYLDVYFDIWFMFKLYDISLIEVDYLFGNCMWF